MGDQNESPGMRLSSENVADRMPHGNEIAQFIEPGMYCLRCSNNEHNLLWWYLYSKAMRAKTGEPIKYLKVSKENLSSSQWQNF